MAPDVLGHEEDRLGIGEGRAVDAPGGSVPDRLEVELLHPLEEPRGLDPKGGGHPGKESRVDPEGDSPAAAGGQDPLLRQLDRLRELDVGAPIDLGDGEAPDLRHVGDHLLEPEVPDDQAVQPLRGRQEGDESLAVHVDRERLLADHLALDLGEVSLLPAVVGPHARLSVLRG